MKLINFQNLFTGILSITFIAGFGIGWNWAMDKEARIEQLEQSRKDDMQEIKGFFEQMTAKMDKFEKRQLTVIGRAKIQDMGDACCVRINVASKAAEFANLEQARIINLSHPDMPGTIAKIVGTFSNSDGEYLMSLSKTAANLIDAVDESWVDIRIEPVED